LTLAITAGVALSMGSSAMAAENGKFRIGVVTFLSGPAAGPFGEPSRTPPKCWWKG